MCIRDRTTPMAKRLLLENVVCSLKEVQDCNRGSDLCKSRGNLEVLSTSISDCYSMNLQMEKDVEELEERIIKLRMVKFENNEDVETMEEELF